MILVNVFFQELNRDYDFKVDRDAKISKVVDEIVGMIGQTEHIQLGKNPGLFLLCKRDEQCVLQPETTLAQNGVGNGDTLLLI